MKIYKTLYKYIILFKYYKYIEYSYMYTYHLNIFKCVIYFQIILYYICVYIHTHTEAGIGDSMV